MTKKEPLIGPKSHHYRRVSLLSLRFSLVVFLLLALLGVIFWRLAFVTENDVQEYKRLTADAESSRSSAQGTPYTARQERQGVQKDMFFYSGSNRLQIRLIADKAQLVLDHQDAHTYIVEQMQKVKCFMQEELYYLLPNGQEALLQPNGQLLLRSAHAKDQAAWLSLDTPGLQPMAIIRYIEADEAEYHYKDDRFVAHLVKIIRYAVPGHQLKEIDEQAKPLMKGAADKVEFSLDGKIIALHGNATVDHELGKVEAQQMTLTPETEGKKLRLANIKMNEGVKIALQDGGKLSCEEAEIDYHTLTGKFSGGPQEHVTYNEYLKGRDLKVTTAFEVKSRTMGIRLQQENQKESSSIVISQITADNDVSVHYNNDFLAVANHGLYERGNEQQDVLVLRDDVEVNYKGVGKLTNPSEIQIHRKLIDGRKQVSLIDCAGQSVLNYQDEKKNESHVLTTHNKFMLDHQLMRAHLDSPRDVDNNVLENLQVHFIDPMGEIYADEVFVDYKEINKRMTPIKLLLKGNVWLLSRTSADKDDPGKVVQFAMADCVEYDIAAKEMLCMADFNKRVLFFDKNNNLQISAPAVKAKRDSLTQKNAIQGMGDVRFSFIEKEFEQLKKRFESRYSL